jgi:hypothetical protein
MRNEKRTFEVVNFIIEGAVGVKTHSGLLSNSNLDFEEFQTRCCEMRRGLEYVG